MTPVRIDLTFSGLASLPEHPIHMDGLLMALAQSTKLPVEKSDGIYMASVFHIRTDRARTPATRHTLLRVLSSGDVFRFCQHEKKVISSRSGRFKNCVVKNNMVWAHSATAYAVGDHKEIKKLLENLRYFGSLRRYGYGKVVSVTVTEDDDALSMWKSRALPAGHPGIESNWIATDLSHQPPYWVKDDSISFVPPSFFEAFLWETPMNSNT